MKKIRRIISLLVIFTLILGNMNINLITVDSYAYKYNKVEIVDEINLTGGHLEQVNKSGYVSDLDYDDYINEFIGTWDGTWYHKPYSNRPMQTINVVMDISTQGGAVYEDKNGNKYISTHATIYKGNPIDVKSESSATVKHYIGTNKVYISFDWGPIDHFWGHGVIDFTHDIMQVSADDENMMKRDCRASFKKRNQKTINYLKPFKLNMKPKSLSQVPVNGDLLGKWEGVMAARKSSYDTKFNYCDIQLDIKKETGRGKSKKGVEYINYSGNISYNARKYPNEKYKGGVSVTYYPKYSRIEIDPNTNVPPLARQNEGIIIQYIQGHINSSFNKMTGYDGWSHFGYYLIRENYKVINFDKVESYSQPTLVPNKPHNPQPKPVPSNPNKPQNNRPRAKNDLVDKADKVVMKELTFSDLPKNHWAYEYVQFMNALGIINGYPDGTFRPSDTFSRAAFAKILSLSYGLEPYTGSNVIYSDVHKGDWFYPYVMAADTVGAINYYNETDGTKTYRPNIPTEREDVAVALVTLLGLNPDDANLDLISGYNDFDEISTDMKPYVALAYETEIMRGDDKGNFMPHAPLTRAQACKVFAVVLAALAEEE